jgi:hypothetical protein
MATRLGDLPQIILGDLLFNLGTTDTGAKWYASMTGWDSPTVRPRTIPGELVDGDHWQPGLYGPRVITLSGVAYLDTPSANGLRAVRERFNAVATVVRSLVSLSVGEPGVTIASRTLDVYTVDPPQVTFVGCRAMRFTVGLSAPDARKSSIALGSLALVETMPTVRGASSEGTVSNTVILNVPTGSTTGDVLLAFFDLDAAGVTGVPAGWTLTDSQVYVGTRSNYLYRRVAGGAEPASYTWNLSSSDEHSGVMVSIRGSDTASIGVESKTAHAVAADLVWPAQTPAARSVRVFGAGFPGVPAPAFSTPAGLVVQATPSVGGAGSSGSYVATSLPSSGATDAAPGVTVPIVAQRTSGEIAVNPPPLTPRTMVVLAGTANVPPTLTVVGPTISPIILCNWGRCLRIDTALGSSDVLVVDFRDKSVTINGANRYDLVYPASKWWELTPGPGWIESKAATLETDDDVATLWAGNNAVVMRTTQVASVSPSALQIVATAAGTVNATTYSRPGIVAGQDYSATASFRPRTSTLRNVSVEIIWLNSSGTAVSTSSGSTIAEVAGAFVIAPTLTATAPAGAISAALSPRIDGLAIGEIHYIDGMGLYLGTSVPSPYDGRQANALDYSGGGTATLTWAEADW